MRLVVTHPRIELLQCAIRNVRWIAHDELEPLFFRQLTEEITGQEADAPKGSVLQRVFSCQIERIFADVGSRDAPGGPRLGEAHRDTPTAGAEIQSSTEQCSVFRFCQHGLDQDLRVRARHENSPIDQKLATEKFSMADDVRQWLA